MIYWDYSQLNSIVKQVEECGDKLHACAELVGNSLVAVPDGRVKEMLVRLCKLAKHIDFEALKIMAEYDSFARKCKRDGLKRDPRRPPSASIFRTDAAVTEAMDAGERPKKRQKPKSRRVAKRKN